MTILIKEILKLLTILFVSYLLLFLLFRTIDNKIIKEKNLKQQHLIFGNSHIMSSLDPEIISKLTSMDFRSYASSGQALFWSVKGIEKKIKQIDNPIIYIEFTNNSYTTDWWLYDNTRMLRETDKLYQLNLNEFKYLFDNNPTKTLKYLITIPFPSAKIEGKYGVNKIDRLKNDIKDNGERIISQYTSMENNKDVNIGVKSLIKTIKNYPKIKFIIVRSPMHPQYFKILHNFNNDKVIVKQLELFKKQSNCKVLDFGHFPLNDSCFADIDHLNYKGARIFSKVFSDSILIKY